MTVVPETRRSRRRAARQHRRQAMAATLVAGIVLATLVAGSTSTPSDATVDPTVHAGTVVHCDGDHFQRVDRRTVRCIAATPITVPTTVPRTSPPPVVPPTLPPGAAPGCGPRVPLLGDQRSLRMNVPSGTSIDARQAVWHSDEAGDYAVSLLGTGAGTCWLGGFIVGDWPASDEWDLWHHRSGLRWSEPNATVQDTVIVNEGDALKPKDEDGGQATDWTVRHVHVVDAHDDCLENDYVHSGLIESSLFESCYVGLSARPSDGNHVDGRNATMTIRSTLLHLVPMQSVYKGPSPGTGGFFKWTDDQSPALAISNSIFRADQEPNHQDLGLPDVPVTCHGNVVLWGGPGAFPGRASWLAHCPDTVIVEGPNAARMWDAAVATWRLG